MLGLKNFNVQGKVDMPSETVQVKILNFKIQKMNFKKWTGTNNQQK